jgi:hypothetical protein
MNYLLVCDFDDTLCYSPSVMINVKNKLTNDISKISTHDWKNHIVDTQKNIYDWSEFDCLSKNHKPIMKILNILRDVYDVFGSEAITVLTARNNPSGPQEFLKLYGLNDVKVVALGAKANDNAGKAKWIKQQIVTRNLNFVEYYEDNDAYIHEVKKLQNELKNDVKISIFKVNIVN